MRHLVIFLIISGFFATNADNIECEFTQDYRGYKCNVLDMKKYFITGVNGNHLPGKSNADVSYFEATSKTLEFIPQGIQDQFPNFKSLRLNFEKLTEIIDEDLKPFGDKLNYLSISNSSIEVIPSNIFASTPNINYMYFAAPNLKSIENGAFDVLNDLKALFVRFPCEEEDALRRSEVEILIQSLSFKCHDEAITFVPRQRPLRPIEATTIREKPILTTTATTTTTTTTTATKKPAPATTTLKPIFRPFTTPVRPRIETQRPNPTTTTFKPTATTTFRPFTTPVRTFQTTIRPRIETQRPIPTVKPVQTTPQAQPDVTSGNIECEFIKNHHGYGCIARNMKLSHITGVVGNHLPGMSNGHVTFFQADSKDLKFIPGGIRKQFPYVKGLKFNFEKLEEIIEEDLKPFGEYLTYLSITSSIEEIQKNVFASTPNINYLYLSAPNLKNIEHGVFKNLARLNALHVKFSCEDDDALGRKEVEEFVDIIERKCSKKVVPIQIPAEEVVPANTFCKFVKENQVYKCIVENMDAKLITSVNEENHLPGLSNANITYFEATSKTLTIIPKGISNHFPNIRALKFNFEKLAELSENDLKPFGTNLVLFSISTSAIEVLQNNVFDSTPYINSMLLKSPHLKYLENGVFDRLPYLKELFVQFPCLNEDASSRNDVLRLINTLRSQCNLAGSPKPTERTQDVTSTQRSIQTTKQPQGVPNENSGIVECQFIINHDWYGCIVNDMTVSHIKGVRGIHLHGKSNADVQFFEASSRTLKNIPTGIKNHFPFVTDLEFNFEQLTEIIESDFRPFGNSLENLTITNSLIEVIPSNIFASTPNIKQMVLIAPNLKKIDYRAFERLNKLIFLDVNFPCISEGAAKRDGVLRLIDSIRIQCYGTANLPTNTIQKPTTNQRTVQATQQPQSTLGDKSGIVECQFIDINGRYSCIARDVTVSHITGVRGNHLHGKFNAEVLFFQASSKTLKNIPKGIKNQFPYITDLEFNFEQLTEIKESDLRPFGFFLEYLAITNSMIEVIPSNVFSSTPNIKSMVLSAPNLKQVQNGAFAPLKNLISLNVNFYCLPGYKVDSRPHVEFFIDILYQRCSY